jgi:hypothetical protein
MAKVINIRALSQEAASFNIEKNQCNNIDLNALSCAQETWREILVDKRAGAETVTDGHYRYYA